MIRCAEARERLEAYYDEQCPPQERQALETHLANCPSCRQSLDEWIDLSRRVFPSDRVKAPPFLWTRVLANIEAQEARQASPWWVQWRWMSRVTAVASLFVTLATAYLFRSSLPTLDTLLEGRTPHQQAILTAMASTDGPDQTAGLVLGGSSWEEN